MNGTANSYYCTCREGFVLSEDQHTCIGKGQVWFRNASSVSEGKLGSVKLSNAWKADGREFEGSQFLKNHCFERVVLCCFAFLLVLLLLLPCLSQHLLE